MSKHIATLPRAGVSAAAIRLAVVLGVELYLLVPFPGETKPVDLPARVAAGISGIVIALCFLREPKRRSGRLLEALADVGLITALVAVSGGAASPLFALYFAAFIAAARYGDPAIELESASLSMIGYLGAVWAYVPGHQADVAARLAMLLLGAALSGGIAAVLCAARKHAERLSTTDAVTGVHNQAHFSRLLEVELSRARRYGLPVSVILLDIDNLKQVNREHGLAAGDHVLRELASLVRRNLRMSDIVARYAGDELVALLPHTEGADAYLVAQRIRTLVEGMCIVTGGKTLRVTLCAGAAGQPADAAGEIDLLQRAREALARSQSRGPNHAALYSPPEAMWEFGPRPEESVPTA